MTESTGVSTRQRELLDSLARQRDGSAALTFPSGNIVNIAGHRYRWATLARLGSQGLVLIDDPGPDRRVRITDAGMRALWDAS